MGWLSPAHCSRAARRRSGRGADAALSCARSQSVYDPGLRARVIWNGRTASNIEAIDKQPMVLAAGRIWDAAKNLEAARQRGQGSALAGVRRWPRRSRAWRWRRLGAQRALARARSPPAAISLWYAQAAIFVAPARYEPFGLAALEAALAGCALVLGDIPTLARAVDRRGPVRAAGRPRAAGAACSACSLPTTSCAPPSADWRGSARATFSAARMTTAYRNAYAEVIASHAGAIRALAP